LYSSPDITRPSSNKADEIGATCGTQGEKRNTCRDEVGKPGGRKSLGRPRRRWACTIKMHLKEEE